MPRPFARPALFLALAALAAFSSACSSRKVLLQSRAQFEAHVKATRKPEFRRPGVVAAAVRNGSEAFFVAAGQRELSSRIPVDKETSYLWFSVTKLFTATAVMQLVEAGKLDLDQPVASYLKEFKVDSLGWAQPTLRQLLGHSAGLPRLNPLERFKAVHLAEEPAPTNSDLLKAWTKPGEPLVYRPGTKFEYSNVGYLWLGLLVERVSGKPYEAYVTERILKPLGMKRTGFVHADIGQAARGYARTYSFGGVLGALLGDERLDAGKAWGYRGIRNYYVDGPAYAGLVGPVSDMEHFVRMQLEGGTYKGKRILKAASLDAMRTPLKDLQGKPLQAGIAWWVDEASGERVCFHEGMGGGFRTQVRIYPERGYGVIVASNDHEYDTFDITRCVVSPEVKVPNQ